MNAVLLVALGVVLVLSGCSGPQNAGAPPANGSIIVLSSHEAAEMASRLANDECERLYHVRPFRPTDNPVLEEGAGYRWGGLDVRGIGGFSALVRFNLDGSNPQVEVYYSTDRRYVRPEGMWVSP